MELFIHYPRQLLPCLDCWNLLLLLSDFGKLEGYIWVVTLNLSSSLSWLADLWDTGGSISEKSFAMGALRALSVLYQTHQNLCSQTHCMLCRKVSWVHSSETITIESWAIPLFVYFLISFCLLFHFLKYLNYRIVC